MKLSPESLARASSRHPWRTLGVWLVVIIAAGMLSGVGLSGVLNQDIAFTNKPESVRAQDIIDARFTSPGNKADSTEFYVIQSKTSTVDDAQYQALVTKLKGQIAALDHDTLVGQPVTYYDVAAHSRDQAAGLVSKDRRTTLISVGLRDASSANVEKLREVAARNETGGFTVQVAGEGTLGADFTKIAEEDLRKGESIGIGIALIVLIVVFAAVVAAVVPIVMALFAIAVALGLVTLIGQLFEFNLFVTNMVTMIGLAVGIDYSLFIVSRYREERKKGFDKLEAIGGAGATANRAVFFSGLTVVLALLGMFIIPTTIFRALAGGAILVTLAAIAASMTLLPAILSLLGDRINWPRISKRARVDSSFDPRGGVWDRITRGVMARPVVFLVASLLVLGGLGSFYFQLHRGTSQNVSQLSDDFPSKKAFLTLEREFSGGQTDPTRIVITGDVKSPEVQAAIARLRQSIASAPAFAARTDVITSRDGSAIEVDAFFKADPNTDTAFQGIRDLRSTIVPAAFKGVNGAEALVGGNTAFFTDFLDVANRYQWIVLAFVLGLSFVLLTVVFRSIVVPVTAIIMNLLSVAAAYGAVTLVFQKGFGIGLFNALGFQFQKAEAIEAWLPLFLFSILFGLSMDYHVFLLSRIREEYDKTRDNSEAVAYGLRTTAGIITGAALIMVAVFIGFAAGRLGPLQQMGFGLAVAVFIDATIVRTLLVPATMRLLGKRNWYLPSWLQWLPQLRVEGREPGIKVIEDEEPVLVGTDG
jgi:putative drug exporter of the RND superfamily